MDIIGCSFKAIMSISILLFLSILLPLSLGQGACDPNPCLNGGTCRPGLRKPYYCVCLAAYLGVHCETSRRIYCEESPCENGATCVTVKNGGYCKCANNYWGTNCDIRLDSADGYTVGTIISMTAGSTIGIVSLCICIGYVNYKFCCGETNKSRPINQPIDLNDEFTIMDA
ncbi:fibropellin-3-like [Anneissia japonica]|uniref:fibropellin-3-like n=1 Tax=Anneissia japonica TaxID=1529436 RepID=UPI0014255450|nr:fibropellin-3-like [Anneissia japonica]